MVLPNIRISIFLNQISHPWFLQCMCCFLTFIKHMTVILTDNFDYRLGTRKFWTRTGLRPCPFLLQKNIIINDQDIQTDLNNKTWMICGINPTPNMMHYNSGQELVHCLPLFIATFTMLHHTVKQTFFF